MTQIRVLLVAEAANPEFVSVPLVGWSHSRAISRITDAYTVTQVRNRKAFLDSGLCEPDDFLAIDSEYIAKPIYQFGQVLRRLGLGWTSTTALAAVSYYGFERELCRKLGQDIMSGRWDLVHRITPLSPTIPSFFLARVCKQAGVPLVLGPLNGGVPWPSQFRRALFAEGEFLAYVRSAYKLLPGYRSTLRHASAIIVGSGDTRDQMPPAVHDKLVYIAENAVDIARFEAVAPAYESSPLRVGFVGRLVPYKGADMMLEALAEFVRDRLVEVHIYGDGPERSSLDSICSRHGISSGVVFHGWVEHRRLQHELSQNHMLVFPSIREFGGGVVLEAMAMGVVPAVVDYGGPGELVTAETGFAIPMGSRDDIIRDTRECVRRVLADPVVLERMRVAGMSRVREHFTWEAKANKVLEVYRWAIGHQRESPEADPGFLSNERSGRRRTKSVGVQEHAVNQPSEAVP